MSSRNSPTLTLDVRTRRTEPRAAWLALVAAACAVVLLNGAALWTQVLAASGVGAIAWGLWQAGWIGSRHRIVAVRWLADGRWVLADSQGNAVQGELSADTQRVRDVVWLRWRTGPGRRRSMLLTRGDMPAKQLRALAVRLQIEAPIEVPTKVPSRSWSGRCPKPDRDESRSRTTSRRRENVQ